MSWTKKQIIEQAYAEIGKGAYDFDLEPDLLQSGLRQLDAMMAVWALEGIRIGFAGGDGYGQISDDALVPIWAVEGLYLNLAIRLAPSFGKVISPLSQASAKSAKDAIQSRTTEVPARAIVGYGGAGNQRGTIRGNSLVAPIQPLQSGTDGNPLF